MSIQETQKMCTALLVVTNRGFTVCGLVYHHLFAKSHHPGRRIILHQDNASSHTAQKTRQYLTEENVELLDHPPYSPDLSSNDVFTFPKIKIRLRG
ncbi:unnamed protein product [Acanthoscelides obtectus]|uniref:Transposase n=1 Tax=Acanthoscelides obtectus TaxID=200917 RepID=A0A9P0QDS4_ACAOB|nr:unnamed protein product [Acanthoscelides obtectus]CAK1687583.1 hypothetical protein AOBTE_LOCUS36293 [Acanthoscelides obtectus]